MTQANSLVCFAICRNQLENQTRSNSRIGRKQKRPGMLLMASRLTERRDGSGLINCYCFTQLTSSSVHKPRVSFSQTRLIKKNVYWRLPLMRVMSCFCKWWMLSLSCNHIYGELIHKLILAQRLTITRTNQANVTFCPHFLSYNKKKLR